MEWFNILRARLRALFRRESVLREIEEELRVHVEMETEANIERGAPPDEAQAAALKSFGNLGRNTERGYDIRGGGRLETLWLDLRYGARMLMKDPGFTAVAMITLALSIGANAAIFSVVNATLLRPLPYDDPDRLIMIRETKLPEFRDFSVGPGDFLDWKKQNTIFERLVAMNISSLTLIGAGDPEMITGMRVTDGFFAMLGARPQIGRDFLPEEDQPGRDNVVILSHGLWQSRFGGNPNIINQAITLSGRSYTVIGVMPSTFRFGDRGAEFWRPMAFTAGQAQQRGRSVVVIGRLRPGVALDHARLEMSMIADRLAKQYPDSNAGWSVALTPLLEYTVKDIKLALLSLLGAVAFVLLIACVNIANLSLARSAAREKEIAVRASLGASRSRIASQFLTESLLLALCGGAGGLALAGWGMDLLLSLAPEGLPRLSDVSLDSRVLVFTSALTLLVGLGFGLFPALQSTRRNLNETLNEAGRAATDDRRRRLVRSALIVAEIALALVLLVGAGLLIESFVRLRHVPPGFNTAGALAVGIPLSPRKYTDEDQQAAFYTQLIERVSGLPGVEAAGAVSILPLGGGSFIDSLVIDGRTPYPAGEEPTADWYSATPGYFKVMGIPLLRGRLFTERDAKGAPRVAIINEKMAKTLFPGENPIGKRFNSGGEPTAYREIVGIVGDVRHYSLDQETTAQIYEPNAQWPSPYSYMTLIARASGDPTSLAAAIRGEVLKIDKEQPIVEVKTLDQFLSTSVAQQRFSALLFGIFAVAAMALACVGIYGVLSYSVAQRRREIGVRMAMGACSRDVLKLVVGQAMLLTFAGVVIGLGAAFALTRLMGAMLFGVSPTDPMTFGLVSLILVAIALLAALVPAWRATKVDPMIALRSE
jgi:putative ABC transport system permease protein